MRIARIQISNFRNFRNLDIHLDEHVVLVGENKIGKSNFLFALRLVLDPSMSDTARQLRAEDFWDGLNRPLKSEDRIRIDIDLTDYENDTALVALLADALIDPASRTSRLSYVFEPIPSLTSAPTKDADYRYSLFLGDRVERTMEPHLRRRIPLDVLPAMRDAEGSLSNWRNSPLRPLLEYVASRMDRTKLSELAGELESLSDSIVATSEMTALSVAITSRMSEMVGVEHSIPTHLGFSPTDPERLIRAMRLFIDGRKRGVGEASLGSANLLYLVLKQLELEQLVRDYGRDHTFFCIEEPEAHLHPHLQRLVFREYLRPRRQYEGVSTRRSDASTAAATGPDGETRDSASEPPKRSAPAVTKIMTTHSPHIVSVAPVKGLALLKRSADGSTIGVSTALLALSEREVDDLERYLDVNRGELVFARGVLLVEGEAETYLLPAAGRLLGYDFDQLGITVCPVGGTNFAPFLKLIGPSGLDLPFAILTDYDPRDEGGALGPVRVSNIFTLAGRLGALPSECPDPDSSDFEVVTNIRGLFLNSFTLEVDLFLGGQHRAMAETLQELTENGACARRAITWGESPESLDAYRLLKDIEEIGKGRFAQRLASLVSSEAWPSYIVRAIEHVANQCREAK
ncbi:MAG: AAA family ATPase [Gemmatimonadaceae bacterium]|nr:AAA family ATPase [Gemmatimonadaceae bacterium]